MPPQESFSTSVNAHGRWIPFQELQGPEQMALDEILLENSLKAEQPIPCFRFYSWQGPWLSLGYHQHSLPEHWQKLARTGRLQLVRRPSGGGAVLHGSGLTYSLVWPDPPRKRHQAYAKTCRWLMEGFEQLGLPLRFGQQRCDSITENCFAASSTADLVDLNGNKRIGSAQLWRKGQLLQHGEILLDPPERLWLQVFGTPPPPPVAAGIPREGLALHLRAALQKQLPELNWQEQDLSSSELERVKKNSLRYCLDGESSASSSSPEASMDSAT